MSSEFKLTERLLGDVTVNHDGKRRPVKESERKKGAYPYYGASGIVDYVDGYIFEGEYLLIAEDGENLRTRQTPIAFLADGKFWVNNHAHIVTGNGEVTTKYLSYFLQTVDIQPYITGAVMPKLTQGNLKKIPVRFPNLNHQNAIVGTLASLDEKITLNRQINQTLEAMAQAIFKSWFVDFDPVKAKIAAIEAGQDPLRAAMSAISGKNDAELDAMPSPQYDELAATAALFPEELVESELGDVPKGWRVNSLSTLMDISGGTQPPANEFIDSLKPSYIRLIQIRDYETDAHLTYVKDTHKLRKTTQNDIMIARYGASVGRICWGLNGAYNVALVRVICDEVYREFLRTYLSTSVFQMRLAQMSGRSAQAGFNKGDIASFSLCIPAEQISSAYHKIVWPLRSRILSSKNDNAHLAALRDTLLPKLLSGDLSVAELEEST